MRILLATAELVPLTRVGGLGEASSGLVRELRSLGHEVDVVLPDYGAWPLLDEEARDLDVAPWVGPARARQGVTEAYGSVTLVDVPGIARPHPYNDPATGEGWPDNIQRFFAFSAAVAALTEATRPDLLHLNDWHTSPTLGILSGGPPSVLTIHNLAYQGVTDGGWLDRLPVSTGAYLRGSDCNALLGGIRLAQRVIAVSPNYAREILRPDDGFGLDDALRDRGPALTGVLNGIDPASWDPLHDPYIETPFGPLALSMREANRARLLADVGWDEWGGPIVMMVTRLAEQKGVDLALAAVPELPRLGARLILLGSGDRVLAERASMLAAAFPDVMRFTEDFNEGLAHRMFAGSDLLLMPSRFEPCGLTQMQAMAYGTIPVVTPVGGLVDTVIDDDQARWQRVTSSVARAPSGAPEGPRPQGNGFVSSRVDAPAVFDALRRAVRAWHEPARRRALQRRGMQHDWSWKTPARRYVRIYEELQERARAR